MYVAIHKYTWWPGEYKYKIALRMVKYFPPPSKKIKNISYIFIAEKDNK